MERHRGGQEEPDLGKGFLGSGVVGLWGLGLRVPPDLSEGGHTEFQRLRASQC